MRKLAFLLMLCVFPKCLFSLDFTSVYNKDYSISIMVSGIMYGTLTYEFVFTRLENCAEFSRIAVSYEGEGEVLRLNPIDRNLPIRYSTYTVSSRLGKLNPIPNEKIIYRLPYSLKDSLKCHTLYNVNEKYLKDTASIGWKSFQFLMNKGDTVFAMRKGMVVEIVNEYEVPDRDYSHVKSNLVSIEHDDGTIACYKVLEKNSFMVKEGDAVFPGTPLALAGTIGESKYQVKVYVYYNVSNNKYAGTRSILQYAYVNPLFATSSGVKQLVRGDKYRPVCPLEVITSEMSKKEKRKYLK